MADTSQQHQQEVTEPPQTNGVLDEGLTEEERSKMRPADIDADMKEMERRKRVEMMMNSRLFREELERIIETQMKDGSGPSGLLQQISEMMGHQGARFNTSVFKNSNCVVPINDIRGVESMGYAKGEKLLRCKLAAVFRLLDLYGWTQGVGGMITARLNQDQEHFLVNPYGLLYHEVTASSLVKADMQGGVVEQGTTNFGVQIAGYQLHSTIHAARPDIKCIVHIATPSVTAISSTKCGILPLGQESIVIGEVSAHHYISAGPLNSDEREKLARNFGPINKVMLLTNRGALCCGETVEEAFFNVYNTVLACETQLKLMPVGVDNLNLITDEARKAIYEASRKAPVPQTSSVAEPSPLAEKLEKRWRIGGTEFEALMRMLDNAGFRTGYIYRHPLVKSEPPRPRNDVEVPPAVSSLGYLLEEEELYKQGLWKGGRKGNDRTRWLNSPNVYQKVEILETGTPDPKKITKWVSDGSPTHSSTPVKIDGALQFVPKNTNPKEFKQLQQQIKDYRRADKISAGPQSHILEGVTWEEAKKMQDATISGTGEQVVLVGAASKGIIQRGFQHNAMVYKTPYAKNPFDAVTDQELDQYKKEIERKTKGDIYDESQSESEALSSFNISRATHESSTAKSPIQSPVSVTSETEEESRDEPKVLRIETKQVPAPSQPEVVLSDGVSGVSRLSSRSTNSIDDCWRWSDNYDDCVLETARAQELPRPMKPLITEVQKFSKAKQKLKKDFFENYENIISITSNSTSENNDINQKRESAAVKFGRHNINLPVENFENKKKSSTKCQNYRETETEINNIRYTKTADINFAEIVSLPVEYFSTEHTIYNINKRDGKTTGHILEKAENNIEKTTNFYNMKLNTLWDNQTNKNTFQRDNLQHKKEQSNNFESMKDNRDFDNYVNKLQFSNSYSNEEVNTDKTCSFFINDTSKINNNSIKSQNESILSTSEKSFNSTIKVMSPNSQNNDTTTNNQAYTVNNSVHFKNEFDVSGKYVDHYVNELQFDISNYSNDAALDKSTMKSHHNVSNHQDIQNKNIIMNYCNELEFSTGKSQKNITLDQSPVETFELEFNTKMQSLVNSYSTPLEDDTFEKNPLDVNLKLFLENQSDMDNHLSKESFENINAIVKTNVVCDNIFRSSNRESSDSNGNAWTSDSTNCYDDEIERPRKLRKFKSNLDFTFSETDKSSGDFSPVSTPRSSFFSDDELVMKRITRNDSISEVVSSIDANIKPTSKVFVDMLADTENSLKYNLDSQNMSLIYSITPQNDIGCSSQDTTITEDLLEDIEDREDIKNEKNNGLDQRELSKSTYQDLQKSNDETFHRDMSTSVDQIIQELNDAEIHISAANFVDEIIFDIECLNLTRDSSSRYSNKEELNRFIKEKISSINFTRNLAKDLVNNLSYNETSTTSTAKVSKSNEDLSTVENLDENLYVIHEFIHHVVDKHSLGKFDSKFKKTVTDKKVKESMNIELKSLKDDYDVTDEKSLKCSTPIRTRNNSSSEEQSLPDKDPEIHERVQHNVTTDCKSQQSSDNVSSSTSSPSTESQNFAEQEITSESTDNDTKSDNSKEKQTSILKNSQSSNDQLYTQFSSDSPESLTINQSDSGETVKVHSKEVSFCIIECFDECGQIHSDYINDNFDLDASASEFEEDFINSPEKIDAMWHNSEIKSDEVYALERLAEISNKNLDQDSEEKIDELRQLIQNDAIAMIAGIENQSMSVIEEQSTSFIEEDDDEIDNRIDSHHQFEKVDECSSCYKEGDTFEYLTNTNSERLSTISEEPELEYVLNTKSTNILTETFNVTKSFESLPLIIQEPDLNLSYDDDLEESNDSRTTEFHSCLNSASINADNEAEITDSTSNVSNKDNSGCEKTYSAEVSVNNNVSATAIMYSSEFNIFETCNGNITKNVVDISSTSSIDINKEEVVLEYMTYSYDTNEFIKLERACSDSSNDSSDIYVTADLPNAPPS